jgi:hypothetical protein
MATVTEYINLMRILQSSQRHVLSLKLVQQLLSNQNTFKTLEKLCLTTKILVSSFFCSEVDYPNRKCHLNDVILNELMLQQQNVKQDYRRIKYSNDIKFWNDIFFSGFTTSSSKAWARNIFLSATLMCY